MSLQIESFDDFKRNRLGFLNGIVGQAITSDSVHDLSKRIDEAFSAMHNQGIITLAADGMRVVSGKAVIDSVNKNQVNIKWVTDGFPKPRYPNGNIGQEKVKAICLGFYKEYDLYVVYQGPIPPTIVARYGSEPSEYETLNPGLVKMLPEHPEHFYVAIDRLKMINQIDVFEFWGLKLP